MNNRNASGSTSSSTDTLEPTPGGSARTTPYDLQSSTNPIINPSRISLRNFGFTSTIGIPSNSTTNPLNSNLSNAATGLLMSRYVFIRRFNPENVTKWSQFIQNYKLFL